MKLLVKTILLTILLNQSILAQNKPNTISGFIISTETGLSLENVHIQNINSTKGTITNKLGYFEIENLNTDTLKISCISYNVLLICSSDLTTYTKLIPSSLELNEVVLRAKTWQQFKLEFVQKEWAKEQSAEISIIGVKQYKEPIKKFKPSLATAVTNPISFTYHVLNKKSRQKLKSNRYRKIIQKSYYLKD